MRTGQITSFKKEVLFQLVTLLLGVIFLSSCARGPGGGSSSSSSCGPAATSYTTTLGALDGVRLHTAATNGDGAVGFKISNGTIKVKTVSIGLARIGSPTGTVTVTLETDSAGNPSGTVLRSGTFNFNSTPGSASYVDTTPAFYDVPLNATATLSSADAKYWIRVARSGAASSSDFILWAGATSLSQFTDVLQLNLSFTTWFAPTGTGDLMAKFTCDTSS